MGRIVFLYSVFVVVTLLSVSLVKANNANGYFTWTVTYGTASPMGVPQQVILINGKFPDSRPNVVTNDNLIINVINKMDAPFLLTWHCSNFWIQGNLFPFLMLSL